MGPQKISTKSHQTMSKRLRKKSFKELKDQFSTFRIIRSRSYSFSNNHASGKSTVLETKTHALQGDEFSRLHSYGRKRTLLSSLSILASYLRFAPFRGGATLAGYKYCEYIKGLLFQKWGHLPQIGMNTKNIRN